MSAAPQERGLSSPQSVPAKPAFRERAGGEVAVRKFLRALTVTEKLVGRGKAGRPAARASRAAYKVVRAAATAAAAAPAAATAAAAAPAAATAAAAAPAAAPAAAAIPAGGLLVIPRVKGAPFLRTRGPGGRPLIDAIEAAPRGATRTIQADACVAEELLYDYSFAPDEPPVKCLCGAATCRGTINTA
jgi:hypothetical protein